MGFEEIAGGVEVTPEEQGSNEGRGHHLRVRHLSLRVLLMVVCF